MPIGYLNSDTLIATIKREGMIPSAQSTFTSSDFLSIANQEMRIGLVPSILQYHQEYYARYSEAIPLVTDQSAYAIPYRAIGGKFREVFYKDESNNLRSMTRISPDDVPYYQGGNFQNNYIGFYLQGNEIVIVPSITNAPTGSIVFSYYLRPNELVALNRVATIRSITKTYLYGSVTNISVTNPSVLTSENHGLTSGNIITIVGSDSTPSIDGMYSATVIDADTFSIPVQVTVAGTKASWTYFTTTYTVDAIPTGFTATTMFDIMQTNPGHKTYKFDKTPLAISSTNKTITFNTSDSGSDAIVGDYISFAGECIIPQAPSDLHDVLAQRVVTRCLQALGDQPGMAMASQKLGEMEQYTATLIDNRAEGTPVKINNVRGLLRSSKNSRFGW